MRARSALQQLLGDALDLGGLDLALVRLQDVADEAADLLGVGDAEGPHALLDERLRRSLVHALRQVAFAELLLEPEARGLFGTSLTELLVFRDGLLELLAVAADDLEHEGVVDLAREVLCGAALLEPGLEHADDVGGAAVFRLDGLREPGGQLVFKRHGPEALAALRRGYDRG